MRDRFSVDRRSPIMLCMRSYLCLEPILPVATPVAALWPSTCKPYNCLIFRGHVRPNARLTVSMHVNARENHQHSFVAVLSHKLAPAQTKQKKKKEKTGFAHHLLTICRKKHAPRDPDNERESQKEMQEASRMRAENDKARTVWYYK